jgi:hypothetical protein
MAGPQDHEVGAFGGGRAQDLDRRLAAGHAHVDLAPIPCLRGHELGKSGAGPVRTA